MTDYSTCQHLSSTDVPTASALNNCFAHFEAIGRHRTKTAEAEVNGRVDPSPTPVTLSEHVVKRALKRVNTKKAAGLNGINGWVIKLQYVLTNWRQCSK